KTPADLKKHACINWRRPSSGALYRWELERRGRAFEIEVEGPLVANDTALMIAGALQGLGIAYLSDVEVAEHLESGRLVRVLLPWSPRFDGFFLYYPHRQQLGSPVRAFVEFFRKALPPPR
ncbi:MAG TPA: LysR substrate-binding domain-containing protein, partial [Polyangiaceae bacterium]